MSLTDATGTLPSPLPDLSGVPLDQVAATAGVEEMVQRALPGAGPVPSPVLVFSSGI